MARRDPAGPAIFIAGNAITSMLGDAHRSRRYVMDVASRSTLGAILLFTMSDITHPHRAIGPVRERNCFFDGRALRLRFHLRIEIVASTRDIKTKQRRIEPDDPGWWSQTGSNRRPPACKAGALPTELWPRTGTHAPRRPEPRTRESLVGLGRLELPTSRLSSARSNQLSYKPEHGPTDRPPTPIGAKAARARPRRKRKEDGGVPPMGL
jgi:hypothetical protein